MSRHVAAWDWVGLIARLALAAVWLVSGLSKAFDPNGAKLAVRAYQLLPNDLADMVGLALPWVEIAFGVLLVVGMATRWVAIGSALLLLAFIGGVISAAARGLSIDCGCFGGGGTVADGETEYTLTILRDAGFLILAGYLAVRPRSRWSVDGTASPEDVDPDEDMDGDITDGGASADARRTAGASPAGDA